MGVSGFVHFKIFHLYYISVDDLPLCLGPFLCTTFANNRLGKSPCSSPGQSITPLADSKNSKPAANEIVKVDHQ